MTDPILLMCVAFVVFAMLRFSIALMMFGCGLVYLWASKQDIGLIVDQTLNSSFQLNVLLAVPMFILAGNVMNAVDHLGAHLGRGRRRDRPHPRRASATSPC